MIATFSNSIICGIYESNIKEFDEKIMLRKYELFKPQIQIK